MNDMTPCQTVHVGPTCRNFIKRHLRVDVAHIIVCVVNISMILPNPKMQKAMTITNPVHRII